MHNYRIAWALVCGVLAAAPATAQGNTHQHHRHHPHEVGARLAFVRTRRQTRRPPNASTAVVSAGNPIAVGMGDVSSIGCEQLPLAGSTTVRIIQPYYSSPTRFIQCAQNATRAGYNLLLAIQYGVCWSPAQDAAWFRQVLDTYAPYHPYAVSVGNEEELRMSYGCGYDGWSTAQLAQRYSGVWKIVAPIIASNMPGAVRVAGEISPWGLEFMQDAAVDGLPGAQVFAAHVYPSGLGSVDPAAFASLARSYGVQAWATEGMCGPGAWVRYGCRTADSLRIAGISLASEWFAGNPLVACPTVPVPSPPGVPSSTS